MSTKKTEQTLNKCEELIDRLNELKKALGTVTHAQSNRKPASTLGAGWSHDSGTGAFHHSTHGVISTSKHPNGHFQISHNGGQVGRAASAGEAGAKIKQYVGSLDKSNYGPKDAKLYSPADNAKRKMNNTGDQTGFGRNVNTKAFSTKPGQLSAKQQAAKTPYKGAAGPVKQYTPEQIAAINEARKLKKNSEEQPWVQHGKVPNADYEVEQIKKNNPAIPGEDALCNQLANMMAGKAMLGIKPPPQLSADEFIRAGEQMGLAASEDQLQKAEHDWNNRFNWLQEACKPISSRFNSPEEEEQYWNSLRVVDRDDGKPGY